MKSIQIHLLTRSAGGMERYMEVHSHAKTVSVVSINANGHDCRICVKMCKSLAGLYIINGFTDGQSMKQWQSSDKRSQATCKYVKRTAIDLLMHQLSCIECSIICLSSAVLLSHNESEISKTFISYDQVNIGNKLTFEVCQKIPRKCSCITSHMKTHQEA